MINLRKLLTLLSEDERKKAIYLTFFILLSAILDVIGIASILPIVALLSNPNLVESNLFINKFYIFFNMNDQQSFLFYVALFFFIFFLISIGVKTLSIYFQLRFSLMCEYSIGKRLLEAYLYQSYSWFLDRHSSDLARNILSTVSQVVNQAIVPIFNFISHSMVTFFIIMLLIFIDFKLTLIVSFTLGILYGVTYALFSNKLNRKGLERTQNDQERYAALSNAFGSIKETKLGNLENFFIKNFSIPAKNFSKNQSSVQIIGQLPKYFFEAITFGGLLLIILYLMKQSDNFNAILPILSLYAFAGYRLMPALQQLYSALASLRFANASIDSVCKDLLPIYQANTIKEKLDFKKQISLNDITYHYPKSSKTNLNNISIKIPARSTVGIVGATGSGKTTLVDIILGLLEPKGGTLVIDNTIINKKNLTLWQNNIGYVPQQIFLTDQSISSNIAFGVDPELINHEVIKNVSKVANLHNFVINELPEKYDTIIGERGIRLSGGQRQRIGIARALYHNPSVSVLDEATNALDNLTEKAVMDAVHNLNHKITIILITHRLDTIQKCEQVFLLDQGKIIANGLYDELVKSNKKFKKLIFKE
jgi:ABC-type bacteriocin/lantibiotic exporter with double-glycine peptidase domain